MGADTAAHGRQGVAFLDDFQSLQEIAGIHVIDVFLDVDVGGTAPDARCGAIAVMVTEDRLEVDFSITRQGFRFRDDVHALCRRGGRCRDEPDAAFFMEFDEGRLHIAGWSDAGVVTEGGDIDAVGTGYVDDGLSFSGRVFFSVDAHADHGKPACNTLLMGCRFFAGSRHFLYGCERQGRGLPERANPPLPLRPPPDEPGPDVRKALRFLEHAIQVIEIAYEHREIAKTCQ
ncbi:MAG: hypothetical protein A4E73_01170 [Syntrophaceae bacterium PtaU1.Bin231]|nr:MAG: hypothetical protein A4E73_01170 [Syntrophaceae bacterium PtaU1.Bin231]